jgi:hypothetical protein
MNIGAHFIRPTRAEAESRFRGNAAGRDSQNRGAMIRSSAHRPGSSPSRKHEGAIMGSVRFATLAVLALLAGCSEAPDPIPPPNELGPRIEAVREAVRKNEAMLNEPIENHLDALEAIIARIAAAHGEQSVETVQALTETSVLLITKERWDLALPYMERTLELQAAMLPELELPKARGLQ